MKIIGKGTYESAYAANTTNGPTLLGGFTFIVLNPQTGTYPFMGTGTIITLVNDGYRQIEFLGDDRQNIPGDYVILVYGDNPSTSADDKNVRFNLVITKVTDTTNTKNALTTLGWLLIIVGAAAYIYKTFKGVSEPNLTIESNRQVENENPEVNIEETKKEESAKGKTSKKKKKNEDENPEELIEGGEEQ
jgi:hypothetical protein